MISLRMNAVYLVSIIEIILMYLSLHITAFMLYNIEDKRVAGLL